ncbi:MAG: oxidoreductase [Litorilinea sp.]|nr:MAG: oxidoreductase [Litorilinea sp.]
MSNERIRAAIIGTGGIARSHMAALQQEEDRVEVVAAVDIDSDRVRAFSEQYGIPRAYTDPAEMLAKESPQLVHIATPPSTHCELSVQAMEAGAWVLCEKPLCASLAEMDRIEEAEARTGNYTSSVFQWRFGSGGQHLKRLITEGALGRPLVCVNLTVWYRTPEYYAVPWRGKWATELGGCSMGHGIHAMDFMLWLLGEWEEVRAMMGTLDREIEVEDVSMATVRFANGAMASVTNSVLSPREESYLRFDFQKATVELTHLYRYTNENWRYSIPNGAPYADELATWQQIPENVPSSHGSQLRHFLDSMARGERPPVSGPDVRGTIEFLASLYKSAMTGQPVTRGSITPDDPFYHRMCGPCDQSWQRR